MNPVASQLASQHANECDVPGCGRPTRDAAFVCESCLTDLARALGEVPWLTGELETTITRQRGLPLEGGAIGTNDALPWHEKASNAQRRLRNELAGWVRVCSEEHVRSRDTGTHGAVWPVDTLPAMSRWLMWRVDGLGLHDFGPVAVRELTELVATCHRLIDRAPDREFVGRCRCGQALYRAPGAPLVVCPECKQTWDAEQLLEAMRQAIPDLLVTATEASHMLSRYGLETSPRIVYGWEERGRVTSHGTRPGARGEAKTFRFDELMRLAAQRCA